MRKLEAWLADIHAAVFPPALTSGLFASCAATALFVALKCGMSATVVGPFFLVAGVLALLSCLFMLFGATRDVITVYIHLGDRWPGLKSWLRQTSTILGLAAVAGIAAAYFGGTMSAELAIQALVPAVVAMILPGHGDASAAVTKATADAIMLAQASTRQAGIEALARDVPLAVDAIRGSETVK